MGFFGLYVSRVVWHCPPALEKHSRFWMLKPQRMDLPQSLIIHSTKKHSCGFSFSLTFQTAFHLAAQQTGSTSERRQCLVKAKVGKHIVRQQSKSYIFLRNRLKEISSLFLQRYETCMKSLNWNILGWKKFPISFGNNTKREKSQLRGRKKFSVSWWTIANSF